MNFFQHTLSHSKFSFFLFVLFLSFLGSCQGNREEEQKSDAHTIREELLKANTILIDAEDQEIKDFIKRHGWEMEETGSGLRYMIYKNGEGEKAEKGKVAVFHYSVSLITGDLVYSSTDAEPARFTVGRGGVESGLEEGIKLLRVGDKARFIMPSHLAHGVPGDGIKIPPRATIIYDIELIDLK